MQFQHTQFRVFWWTFEGGVTETKFTLGEMSEMSDPHCILLVVNNLVVLLDR